MCPVPLRGCGSEPTRGACGQAGLCPPALLGLPGQLALPTATKQGWHFMLHCWSWGTAGTRRPVRHGSPSWELLARVPGVPS